MQITVQLFAAARDAAQQDAITVDVDEKATASDVLQSIGQSLPAIEPLLASSRLAADDCYLDREEKIDSDQAFALILPVSGG